MIDCQEVIFMFFKRIYDLRIDNDFTQLLIIF